MDLPLAPVEKMLKRTHMRISEGAVKEFRQLIEETISDLASEAVANSRRCKRKTVTADDILAAKRKLL